ncbi:alpha-galactosidase [Actinomyces culturomici]|uniref:alpha-galactosidase n=1 Tax=Actinomyces culturomici TaxID=1926276 RepID=UPI000E1FBFF9|nr:alpha-galactosidase [Actinomyces culturomici]
MIRFVDGVWCVETERTGYYLAERGPLVEHLHYGARLEPSLEALRAPIAVAMGTDVVHDESADPNLSLLHLGLEVSPLDKGDFRTPMLEMRGPDGSGVHDLRLESIEVLPQWPQSADLPEVRGLGQTLAVRVRSGASALVERFYAPAEDCDAIVVRTRVTNGGAGDLRLERALTYQLDLPGTGWDVLSFTGAWVREFAPHRARLDAGSIVLGSRSGVSSHYCNPFFAVCAPEAGEEHGAAYGFNLVWSGSHTAIVEAGPYASTRVTAGIQTEGFAWTLAPGESFETPAAVLAYSDAGLDGLSQCLHALVRRRVVPSRFAGAARPVLVNNWEATYFDVSEKRLDALAKSAAEVGAELFVLDDGWFGRRTSDERGLGDFDVNRSRLPSGLDGLGARLRKRGLDFGLWVEPEMVSRDSALFDAHPDWILASPGVEPSPSRHQFVLDLCRTEVQDHVIARIGELLDSGPIRYVKWDMNRHHSDRFSAALAEQGRLDVAWTLGLYRVLREVTGAHPDVLFESCASGGNRVDLGMLAYMPQVWLSDDTDAWERARIQSGASYAYPQSVWGSHVSASPNHQTLRVSGIEARFDVAAFGLLGYELDLGALAPAERRAVRAQIDFYRKHRELLQFGEWHRLRSPFDGDECAWMVVAPDLGKAAVLEMVGRVRPNSDQTPLRLRGLDAAARYRVTTRRESLDPRVFGSLLNQARPVKVDHEGALVRAVVRHKLMTTEAFEVEASGALLMSAGLRLPQRFTGTGFADGMRAMPDNSARIHLLERLP